MAKRKGWVNRTKRQYGDESSGWRSPKGRTGQAAFHHYTDGTNSALGESLSTNPYTGVANMDDVDFILDNWQHFSSPTTTKTQDVFYLKVGPGASGGTREVDYDGFLTEGTVVDDLKIKTTLQWILLQLVVGGSEPSAARFLSDDGPYALMGTKDNIFDAEGEGDSIGAKGTNSYKLASLYYKIKKANSFISDILDDNFNGQTLDSYIDQRFKDWEPAEAAVFSSDPNATLTKFKELVTEHIKLYQYGEIPQHHHSPSSDQYLDPTSQGGSSATMVVEKGYKHWTTASEEETRAGVGAKIQNGAFRLRSLPYVTTEYFQTLNTKTQKLAPAPIKGVGNSKDNETLGYPLIGPFFPTGMANFSTWMRARITYKDFKNFQAGGPKNHLIENPDVFSTRSDGKINLIPMPCDDGSGNGRNRLGTSPNCWLQYNAKRKVETFTINSDFYGSLGSLIFKGGFAGDATTPVLSTAYVSGDSNTPSAPVVEAGLNTRTSTVNGTTAGWTIPKSQTIFKPGYARVDGFSPKDIVEALAGKNWSDKEYWVGLGKDIEWDDAKTQKYGEKDAWINKNVKNYKGYYDKFVKKFQEVSRRAVSGELNQIYDRAKKYHEDAVKRAGQGAATNPAKVVECFSVTAAMTIAPWMFWTIECLTRIGIFCELSFREQVFLQDAADVDGAAIAARVEGDVLDTVADSVEAVSLEIQLAEADKLSQDEIKNRQKLIKQCALMTNMEFLKNDYRSWIKSRAPLNHDGALGRWAPYQYRFHNIDTEEGERTAIMNKLVLPTFDQIEPFINMTPEVHACLVPKIRLFKVFNNPFIDRIDEVEISFENFENPSRISGLESATFDKGSGAGIKELSFSFEGSNPATSRNDIKANLTMYFQSFNDFIRERTICRGSNPACSYRYVDLVLFPVSANSSTIAGYGHSAKFAYDPSYYRIRADVGWQIRDDAEFAAILNARGGNKLARFQSSLAKINKSFYLNMVDHEFDVRPDGTVEMKIAYRAYLESVMKSPALDALATPKVQETRKSFNKELDKVMSSEVCSADEVASLMAAYGVIEDTLIRRAYQSIMERLIARRRIFHADFEEKDMEDFARMGYFTRRPRFVGEPLDISEASKSGKFKAAGKSVEGRDFKVHNNKVDENFKPPDIRNTEVRVNFFHLGDLLYTVMDCMYLENGKQMNPAVDKTKLLLGSFNYDTVMGSEVTKHYANVADIPISTEYFYEWFTQNVVKAKRKSYPIMNFVRDLCNGLVVEALGEVCFNKQLNKKMRFQTGNFLAVAPGGDPFVGMNKAKDYIINVDKHYGPDSTKKLPLDMDSKDNGISKMYNYMVIYPVTAPTFHKGEGNFLEDGNQGIYHYEIGADRGIVKNIKFSKTDMQYIREARFFRNGFDGLMQLGAVYKVTLDMIGNTLYYPGMEVFLDPRGIGGQSFDPTIGPGRNKKASVANALGFGGYHIVTRVNSVLTPGSFKTTLDAQFHYSGDGNLSGTRSSATKGGASKRRRNNEPGKNPQACQAVLNRRTTDASQLISDPSHDIRFPIEDKLDGKKVSDIIGSTPSVNDSSTPIAAPLLEHNDGFVSTAGISSDPNAVSPTKSTETGVEQSEITLESDPSVKSATGNGDDSEVKIPDTNKIKQELAAPVDKQKKAQEEGVTKRYGPGKLELQGGIEVAFDYGYETDIFLSENRTGRVEQFFKIDQRDIAVLVFEGQKCPIGKSAAQCAYIKTAENVYKNFYLSMIGGAKK